MSQPAGQCLTLCQQTTRGDLSQYTVAVTHSVARLSVWAAGAMKNGSKPSFRPFSHQKSQLEWFGLTYLPGALRALQMPSLRTGRALENGIDSSDFHDFPAGNQPR
jgi:hypothetical protein